MQSEHAGICEQWNLIDLDFNQLFGVSLSGDDIVEVSLGEEELLVAVENEVA